MTLTDAIQQHLVKKLAQMRAENPKVSLRSLSLELGVPVSSLSEIMNGRRRVSIKMGKRISQGLGLSPFEVHKLLNQYETRLSRRSRKGKTTERRMSRHVLIEQEQFEVIAEPIHFALLSLIETPGFNIQPSWMAKRLKCTESKVKKALQNLFNLKMISLEGGQIKRLGPAFETSEDILNLSIQSSYYTDIEVIKENIHTPINFRDYSCYTFSMDPRFLPEAKNIIRKAQEDIEALSNVKSADKTEVFRINNFLYPLTDISELKAN